jgi:hypothetical protein
MEVHHHSHHPKKWKEYVTEFIMLFAAVTLGFFAENIREHQIIEHKTKQNLQSVLLDLKKDSVLIQERTKEYTLATSLLNRLNNNFLDYQYKKITEKEYIENAFSISDSIGFGTSFYINNASYKNTIASGSLSNINSIELKRTISNYYEVYGAKLYDNNKILDDVVEYYSVYTLPKPGGRLANASSLDSSTYNLATLKEFYKSNQLLNHSLLSKEFIIYNQKALDRVKIYLMLMNLFEQKNNELTALIKEELAGK